MVSNPSGPTRALVLAGGGARGAYEAGVLSYLYEEMPKELVAPGRIRVFCGTSVGAIHAAYLAGTAHHVGGNLSELLRFWRSLRIESIFRWRLKHMFELPRDIRSMWDHRSGPGRGIIIESGELQQLVASSIPWLSMRRNLRRGLVKAVTVTASHVASGRTEVFVDSDEEKELEWTRDPRRVARRCHIGPAHVLASAAMPFLFPAVRVHGCYYVDGGLRQNTPLSPALRLGADRVMVVSLASHKSFPAIGDLEGPHNDPYPDPLMLCGKILDALLLDHVDYDLERLESINTIMRDGNSAFGGQFLTHLSDTSTQLRGVPYRVVESCVIRPSIDLGEMSVQYLEDNQNRFKRVLRWLLRTASSTPLLGTSDLLSFILFDGAFAERLIELGRHDAYSNREQLLKFLRD